jgi:hypothetical protein
MRTAHSSMTSSGSKRTAVNADAFEALLKKGAFPMEGSGT